MVQAVGDQVICEQFAVLLDPCAFANAEIVFIMIARSANVSASAMAQFHRLLRREASIIDAQVYHASRSGATCYASQRYME